MKKKFILVIAHWKEIVFQSIVLVVLFLFYSYHQDNSLQIVPYKISFFLNYALAAMLINYVLLPRVYAKQKFLLFFGSIVILIAGVILIDEFVLEQIYFRDTRGASFPGIGYTLIETLPTIIFLVGFKFAWDVIQKQNEIEKLKRLVQESELQFLKSQINPHFLFNNLNNLYAYAIEGSQKTPDIILELSSVLRYMLYDCKEQFVPLAKEIKHLKDYTALHELQIEHRGDIQFDIESNASGYVIAPLILTVFIENAFKHSMASQSEQIRIHVAIQTSTSGVLTFICENSFLHEKNTEHLSKGIGLLNVKKRLAILYPNAHHLKIHQTHHMFTIHLTIQLNATHL